MKHIAILGTQWGDEGKGKMVDILARRKSISAVVRFQGGNNAGHTVVVNDTRFPFHLLPSGVLYPDKTCVVGNGVIIDPEVLLQEIVNLESQVGTNHARLLISEKCHLVMPWHRIIDGITGGKIGTTGRGIGPTYTDYIGRRGIRFVDTDNKKRFSHRVSEELVWNKKLIKLVLDYHNVSTTNRVKLKLRFTLDETNIVNTYWKLLTKLRKNPKIQIGNVSELLEKVQNKGNSILFEGAQATLLDISHGTYPFVTSSNPTLGGLYTGTGFRPNKLTVIGVAKTYTTRVGEGPFPTELNTKVGQRLRDVGHEFGTTTGRPRRCGWLDLTIVNYAKTINGLDALAIAKLDVLTGINQLKVAVQYKIGSRTTDVFNPDLEKLNRVKVIYKKLPGWKEDISGVRKFEQLPKQACEYIRFMEHVTKLPVTIIGVGPERNQIILR